MKERSWVRLSQREQQELRRLLQSGLQPVRTVLRALAVRQLADGQPIRWWRRTEERRVDLEDDMADHPTLSPRRPGAGLVRAATAGERDLAR